MGRPKTYKIDENYFEIIDNSNKAYILGFIFADGSVNKNNLNITIHKKDVEILEFIQKEFNSEHPIKISNVDYVRYSISNKKICSDLYNQNIIPNKTYKTNNLPYGGEFFSHFLRGLFDGDGYIGTSINAKNNDYNVCISNSYYILNELKMYLKDNLNINSYLRLRNKDSYNSAMLEFKGSLQIERFYNFIYKDSNFQLERKKIKFANSLKNAEIFKKTDYKNNGTWEKIKELYLLNISQKEISTILIMPYGSVKTCIQKMRLKNII